MKCLSIYRRKRQIEQLEAVLQTQIKLTPEERLREYFFYLQEAFKSYENPPKREFYASKALQCLSSMKD